MISPTVQRIINSFLWLGPVSERVSKLHTSPMRIVSSINSLMADLAAGWTAVDVAGGSCGPYVSATEEPCGTNVGPEGIVPDMLRIHKERCLQIMNLYKDVV